MNKKLKIVSSIALAGMLVTGGFGVGKVFADSTSNNLTNPVGIYNKLIEGKSVVPFVLANSEDTLTVEDVIKSDLFNGKVRTIDGTAAADQSTLVKTGSIIKTTDGKEYTVVLYGDVNSNGDVSSTDALNILKYSSGEEGITLSEEQKLAANVVNPDDKSATSINSIDAKRILEYKTGITDKLIDKYPAPEEEEVVENYNYTVTINDGGYVNNKNVSSSKAVITIKEALDEPKDSIKLVITDQYGEKVEREITIPKDMARIEVVIEDEEDVKNLKDLADGVLQGTLIDTANNDEIVGKFEVTKNTELVPAVANVNADRTGTRTATLSLEKCGESDITKVKYVVLEATKGEPSQEALENTINVTNGKVENVQIANDLSTNTAYKVWYVVENQYGSQSEIKEAVIVKDGTDVITEDALKTVVAPDLSDTSNGIFTWESNSDKTYIATLYKDGEPVDVSEVSEGEVDFSKYMSENAGTYKVSVVVKGEENGTSKNSTATESDEVTVTALSAVENLNVENIGNNTVKISWSNSNKVSDFKEYKIEIYSVDENNKEEKMGELTGDKYENYIDISTLGTDKIYLAKVIVIPLDDQMEKIKSETVVSNQFFVVNNPTVKAGTNSVTLGITPLTIYGKTAKYKVEVYKVNTEADNTEAKYPLDDMVLRDDVTVNDKNEIVIDGLNPLNTYAFKLIAVINENEVKSGFSGEITTLPEIKNLTVAENKDQAMEKDSSKVYVNGTELCINGNAFDTTKITGLVNVCNIISKLQAGDIVTIDEDNLSVEVKLSGNASVNEGESTERDFTGVDLSDYSVILENNGFTKIIKGTFKTLTLKGVDTVFNVMEVTTDEDSDGIILTNGVEVINGDNSTTTVDYTIESGAAVTINGVDIKTGAEKMSLSATAKDIVVNVNGSSSNDVTFENATGDEATITFKGDGTYTAEQSGEITIKSVGGKVTVRSINVSVSADMKVEVEVNKGEVDIADEALTGNKEVSVTVDEEKEEEAIITAYSEKTAPDKLIQYCVSGKTIDLKDYSNEDMRNAFTGIDLTDNDIIEIDNYISSFGLNGKGAKMNVVKEGDNYKVTITLTKSVDKIDNLK